MVYKYPITLNQASTQALLGAINNVYGANGDASLFYNVNNSLLNHLNGGKQYKMDNVLHTVGSVKNWLSQQYFNKAVVSIKQYIPLNWYIALWQICQANMLAGLLNTTAAVNIAAQINSTLANAKPIF